MQWIDEVAGLVAKRHARMNVTTASVDNLKFLHGAYQRDVIVIIGKATYAPSQLQILTLLFYLHSLIILRFRMFSC